MLQERLVDKFVFLIRVKANSRQSTNYLLLRLFLCNQNRKLSWKALKQTKDSLDDLEDELEEGAEYLAALLQFEAHVEALHVGEVLQEVEVALERGVLEEDKINRRGHYIEVVFFKRCLVKVPPILKPFFIKPSPNDPRILQLKIVTHSFKEAQIVT